MVNKAWFDTLPADLQQIFDDVAVEALAMSDNMYREAETKVIEDLKAYMEVNTLTPEALDGFRQAVAPVYDEMIAAGHFTKEDVDAARAAAASCN
jgi:C4-dicarboxylate-binding protein DctP